MLKLSVIFEKSYGKNERIYYFRKINYYLCKLILNQNKKPRINFEAFVGLDLSYFKKTQYKQKYCGLIRQFKIKYF